MKGWALTLIVSIAASAPFEPLFGDAPAVIVNLQ
jgi:hypothetical protein